MIFEEYWSDDAVLVDGGCGNPGRIAVSMYIYHGNLPPRILFRQAGV